MAYRSDNLLPCPLFQGNICVKLVILRQLVDLGIFQFHAVNILSKICRIVIPEYQFSMFAGKFRIQFIYNLL